MIILLNWIIQLLNWRRRDSARSGQCGRDETLQWVKPAAEPHVHTDLNVTLAGLGNCCCSSRPSHAARCPIPTPCITFSVDSQHVLANLIGWSVSWSFLFHLQALAGLFMASPAAQVASWHGLQAWNRRAHAASGACHRRDELCAAFDALACSVA